MTKSEFSARERDVVALLLEGKSNKQIAHALGISESTVEFHLRNIYSKLHVNSRTEAVLKLGKSIGGSARNELRESTVAEEIQPVENENVSISTRRISMKNLSYLVGTLIITTLVIVFLAMNNTAQFTPSPTVIVTPSLAPAATTTIPTPMASSKGHIVEQIRQLVTTYDQAVQAEKQNGEVVFSKDSNTGEDIFQFTGISFEKISNLSGSLWDQINFLIKLYDQEYRDQTNPTPFPTQTSSEQTKAYYGYLLTQFQKDCDWGKLNQETAIATIYHPEDGKYYPLVLNDEVARCDIYGTMIEEWRVAPVLTKVNKEADIKMIQQVLGKPDLQLTFETISDDPNAPGRNLSLYDDNTGTKYYVDVDTAHLTEIVPNLQTHPNIPVNELKSMDELRGIARQFASTNSPHLAQLENVLLYEENCKGDICFFRWDYRSKDWSGTDWAMMPPLLQVGVLKNGQIITYINTLDLLQ